VAALMAGAILPSAFAQGVHAVLEHNVRQLHDAPVLVRTGQTVELVAQRNGIRLTTSAVTLDPGRLGEKIRVHTETKRKTLIATVIDAHTVEIDY
jgi:flagella basal body P-ring formation protein FlgA